MDTKPSQVKSKWQLEAELGDPELLGPIKLSVKLSVSWIGN